jgi:hypothetical protein
MNWRRGYRLKLALHDGLESIANYATARKRRSVLSPIFLSSGGAVAFGDDSDRCHRFLADGAMGGHALVCSEAICVCIVNAG